MTNEQAPEQVQMGAIEQALMSAGHQIAVSFSIEGVPYSQVRGIVTFDNDGVPDPLAVHGLMQVAQAVADQYMVQFAPQNPRHSDPADTQYQGGDPGPDEPFEREPVQQRQAPPRQQYGQQQEAYAFCPEHNGAPMRPSAPQYNPDGDKFFHDLDPRDPNTPRKNGVPVKSHTLWWRQTVDADGYSNEGQEMPFIPQQQPRGGGGRGGYGGGGYRR